MCAGWVYSCKLGSFCEAILKGKRVAPSSNWSNYLEGSVYSSGVGFKGESHTDPAHKGLCLGGSSTWWRWAERKVEGEGHLENCGDKSGRPESTEGVDKNSGPHRWWEPLKFFIKWEMIRALPLGDESACHMQYWFPGGDRRQDQEVICNHPARWSEHQTWGVSATPTSPWASRLRSATVYWAALLGSLVGISQVKGVNRRLEFTLPTPSSLNFPHVTKWYLQPLTHSSQKLRSLSWVFPSSSHQTISMSCTFSFQNVSRPLTSVFNAPIQPLTAHCSDSCSGLELISCFCSQPSASPVPRNSESTVLKHKSCHFLTAFLCLPTALRMKSRFCTLTLKATHGPLWPLVPAPPPSPPLTPIL